MDTRKLAAASAVALLSAAGPAAAQLQSLNSGATSAATFLTGTIVVQIMTIGLAIAFFVGILNFRAGAFVAGAVVAAGIGASIAPDFAQSLYTWFHTGGGGTVSL